MNDNDFLTNQSEKRQHYLDLILSSSARKKIIVAGPGTGKTHTFKSVLEKTQSNNNLALTFINNLVEDMFKKIGGIAEVKTFHAFCKKILHQEKGRVDIVVCLTDIIKSDAKILNLPFKEFDKKFQCLEEGSPEIIFYLKRGDYYKAVSFNDSVYRLLNLIKDGKVLLPNYDQIVIDEYQDFNPLEIAFIQELTSPILIVGDDDQAVYDIRNSSPDYLRERYRSGEYETFELPFCSRCPKVIVEATNCFMDNAKKRGNFKERIDRSFFPFIEGNEELNMKYPKIITGTVSEIKILSKYITNEIKQIPSKQIQESYKGNYPCVIIVGTREYLNKIEKPLKKNFCNITYKKSRNSNDDSESLIEAYELLMDTDDSNIGWRILSELFLKKELNTIISKTKDGTPLVNILPAEFIDKQRIVIKLLEAIKNGETINENLYKLLGKDAEKIIQHFLLKEFDEMIDDSQPVILLTTFQGCKGLSADYVFIIGLNEGKFPKKNTDGSIDDIEYSKFIVAMTRTKKCCYLLTHTFDFNPGSKPTKNTRSKFINLIPKEFLNDKGFINKNTVDSI